MKSFEKSAQVVDQRTAVFFGYYYYFWEGIVLICLQIAKMEQVDCKWLFVGPFASMY